jgi:ABC-2 type transport system permease protein
MKTKPSTLIKRPSQIRAFITLTKFAVLAAMRNPATLAFGFIFPIVFITVFGLLGNGATTIKLGVPSTVSDQHPLVTALGRVEVVKLTRSSQAELSDLLRKGKVDAVLLVDIPESVAEEASTAPRQYRAVLETTSGNPAGAAAATSVVNGVVSQLNLRLAGITYPPIELTQRQVAGQQSRYIDFALPGQIGFSLLSTAIFGTVFGFIALKRELVLKRIFATPTLPLTLLTAQGTSRLFWALMQTIVILAVGVLAFKFYLPNGWLTFAQMLLLSAIGLIAFLGFGFFMAGLANDENSAGPLVNIVTLPQFLLSGVFFPTDNFPTWVQPLANNLPLSYFNVAMRHITTEGGHLVDSWPYIAGLMAWGAVMYLLAARTFRWS